MKKKRLELVSFDVDGTILRGRILYHVKIPEDLRERVAAQDELFLQGKLEYEEALRIQFELLAGLKVNEIAPDPNKLPLIKDLDATLERLRDSGVSTVILTDNPSFTVEPLRAHGFCDIIASEIETSEGVLTDRMKLLTNKLKGLREYCELKGLEPACCAHVGDWINDIVVFQAVGLSVAFNSSEEQVSKAATYAVSSDSLLDVYHVLEPSLPDR